MPGTKEEMIQKLREDIRDFKTSKKLDKVSDSLFQEFLISDSIVLIRADFQQGMESVS